MIGIVEGFGLTIVAPQDLAPDLIDVPSVGAPSDRDRSDIARARSVIAALGAVDVGQGCVVSAGQVLAVEALPGTDWMLASLAATAHPAPDATPDRDVSHRLPTFSRPAAGVLVKAPKPGQDRRVDLPTIGPETLRRAAAAGLSGIAVERGGVLVLDAGEVARTAIDAGLFVHAFEP